MAEREGDARGRSGNLLKDQKLRCKPRGRSHLRCFAQLRLAAATFRNLRCLPRPRHTDGHTPTVIRTIGVTRGWFLIFTRAHG